MPLHFAERLSHVAPSVTLAMNARAVEMRSRGIEVHAFGAGEPDFEPPAFVLEAAKKAIDDGASKYTAVTGIAPLKQAICDATARTRGWTPKPQEICVSVGAKHALFNLAVALFGPGDEVIVPAPYWVSYPEQVRMMGATPVFVETTAESGWRVSPEALRKAMTPKTKAIILCTPSNPTGAAYPEAHLRALADVLKDNECWVIVDEIYAELVYDGFRHTSMAAVAPELRDRLVIVDGVSKGYAMTGWRIGWAIAPPHLIKALDLVQGQSTTNATAVAQLAAVAALNGPRDSIETMRARFESRRNVMVEGLNSLPGVTCRVPEGAFYAFADCRGLYGIKTATKTLANDEDIAFWLLDEPRVAAVPGGAFGAPGYIRFSYTIHEDRIRAGIEAMRKAITEAKRA